MNIGYSLKITFSTKLDVTDLAGDVASTVSTEVRYRAAKVDVEQARSEDAVALARLMTEHFGYVYSAAFDTSPRMTEIILLSLLHAANGRIPDYGFRSFQVARGPDSDEVLGFMKCSYSKPIGPDLIYWILFPPIIFYHLGITGLIRTLRNWMVLRDMVPTICQDEIYLQYIAVNSHAQNSGVGTRLLEHTVEFGRKIEKSRLALDVREANETARRFFRNHGLREHLLIKRVSDHVIGKGPTIRMELALPNTEIAAGHN
jgi:ribosomal protein S18 acetylase RimI-like enzyme